MKLKEKKKKRGVRLGFGDGNPDTDIKEQPTHNSHCTTFHVEP